MLYRRILSSFSASLKAAIYFLCWKKMFSPILLVLVSVWLTKTQTTSIRRSFLARKEVSTCNLQQRGLILRRLLRYPRTTYVNSHLRGSTKVWLERRLSWPDTKKLIRDTSINILPPRAQENCLIMLWTLGRWNRVRTSYLSSVTGSGKSQIWQLSVSTPQGNADWKRPL